MVEKSITIETTQCFLARRSEVKGRRGGRGVFGCFDDQKVYVVLRVLEGRSCLVMRDVFQSDAVHLGFGGGWLVCHGWIV